jgi:hypothetical protein
MRTERAGCTRERFASDAIVLLHEATVSRSATSTVSPPWRPAAWPDDLVQIAGLVDRALVQAAVIYALRLGEVLVDGGPAIIYYAAIDEHGMRTPVVAANDGSPMTLAQVAAQFEAADIALVDDALRTLQRCRPARPPIYRDGDRYALDPLDAEADLWAFRLGLRPPRHAPVSAPTPCLPPRPNPDARLTVIELDEAWRDADLSNWSAQRLALAVLDAHDRAMSPDEVVAFVSARAPAHRLAPDPTTFRRRNAAVAIAEDGTWTIVPGAPELGMARHTVRDAIERTRRQPRRSSPEEIEASRTLQITTAMLIQGSCGISRPLGDPKKLRPPPPRGSDPRSHSTARPLPTRWRREPRPPHSPLDPTAMPVVGVAHQRSVSRWG